VKTIAEQLTNAYRNQHGCYRRIRLLVEEQERIMQTRPDPSTIIELCRKVEELMEQIAVIERAIEPAKRAWEEDRSDPDGALDQVLGAIEEEIAQIARTQQQVQQQLLDYVQAQQRRTEAARVSINASRAEQLYKAG